MVREKKIENEGYETRGKRAKGSATSKRARRSSKRGAKARVDQEDKTENLLNRFLEMTKNWKV